MGTALMITAFTDTTVNTLTTKTIRALPGLRGLGTALPVLLLLRLGLLSLEFWLDWEACGTWCDLISNLKENTKKTGWNGGWQHYCLHCQNKPVTGRMTMRGHRFND